jgi:hypothetical protein
MRSSIVKREAGESQTTTLRTMSTTLRTMCREQYVDSSASAVIRPFNPDTKLPQDFEDGKACSMIV